jgi:ribosomal protein S18 acetylase RimI-like enzyme
LLFLRCTEKKFSIVPMPSSAEKTDISPASREERLWVAQLLSVSEPWITLGVTHEQCIKTCTDPDYLLFVARTGNQPCGAVVFDPRGMASAPYIKSILVAPEFRNLKVGARLLQYTENYARDISSHIFLCVSSFNTRAYGFYTARGYHAVGELKDYIIPGASEIIMYKHL